MTKQRKKPTRGKDGLARVLDHLGVSGSKGDIGERLNNATKAAPPSLERQRWLEAGVEALRERFAEAGYRVPEKVRVSVGWPKRSASCGAIGECWATEASSDAHSELFISPELVDALRILGVLAHEMAHATVGTAAGHRKPFKRCANAIGLQGPMRATTESPEFVAWAETLFKRIGPYPAGYLTDNKKQGTRLRRCECPGCGYLARVAAKWLLLSGPPICPSDQIPMRLQTAGATEPSHDQHAAEASQAN